MAWALGNAFGSPTMELTESIRSPRMLANRERPEAVWCRVVDEGLESCQVRLGLSMGVARAVGSAAMLMECFYQNRRIIEEFVLGTLAQVPTSYGRLHTVAALRDQESGLYRCNALSSTFSGEAVHETLDFCHKQLFYRTLESSLEAQAADLRDFVGPKARDIKHTGANWKDLKSYRFLVPSDAPRYMGNLFISNVRFLLEVLSKERDRCGLTRSVLGGPSTPTHGMYGLLG